VKRYRYLLLDWDGNLAKTLDIWLASLKISLERHGHFLHDKEIGADFSAFQDRMQHVAIPDLQKIIDEATEIATLRVPDVELYPHVREVLGSLCDIGVRLALVTTSLHAQIDPLLAKYGLAKCFSAVVCGDDVTQQKPAAEPLETALRLLGGDKKTAVMIGDSEKDIVAATNAGIDSVLFHPSSHEVFYDLKKLRQLHPTYIVQDLREILAFV